LKFSAVFSVFLLSVPASGTFAFAGDDFGGKALGALPTPATPTIRLKTRVLVFGDGAARFNVERDASAGRMTFRLADPALKLERAPMILMTTEGGPQEIMLTAVEGQPGAWYWSNDAVKAERFDGSMRVIVAGKTYTAPLTTMWTSEAIAHKARYGGRLLALSDCGASVEIVQDPSTGTLTIYSFDDVVVTEAPVITVTESKGPTTVTLTRVEGRNGAWVTTNDSFKTATTSARIRLLVNGKPCEAQLTFGTGHGG
jgi:hypothetical protein